MYFSALVSINLLVPYVRDRPFSHHSPHKGPASSLQAIHTSSFYLIGTTVALFIFDRDLLAGFVSISLFHRWMHSMRPASVFSIMALLGILACWIHESRRLSVDEGPFFDPRLLNIFISPHTFVDEGLFKRSSPPKQSVFVSGRTFVDGGLFFFVEGLDLDRQYIFIPTNTAAFLLQVLKYSITLITPLNLHSSALSTFPPAPQPNQPALKQTYPNKTAHLATEVPIPNFIQLFKSEIEISKDESWAINTISIQDSTLHPTPTWPTPTHPPSKRSKENHSPASLKLAPTSRS